MRRKTSNLRCGSVDSVYLVKHKDHNIRIQGSEAGVVDYIREELSVKQKIKLLGISLGEIENYLKKTSLVTKEYCLEILSKKWYSRETDEKLQLTKHEFEELEFRTFSQLKKELKKDKLTLKEINRIIEYFTNDYADYYLKD